MRVIGKTTTLKRASLALSHVKTKTPSGRSTSVQQPFGVLLLPWLASKLARFYRLRRFVERVKKPFIS